MTIAMKLMGGLGNQLFQIFTVMAYGIEHSVPFVFEYRKQLNERKTYWDTFLCWIQHYTNMDTNLGSSLCTNRIISMMPVYKEPVFAYRPIPDIQSNFRLEGYFQSYKYFHKHAETLFRWIHLREQQTAVLAEFSDLYQTTTVGVHFRLGDYKKLPQYHPILPVDYYIRSIQYILGDLDQPVSFLCFFEEEDGNEVRTIIRQLESLFPLCSFVCVNTTIVDWKQMLMMSCCHHQIIANSSFSWFSAYFNANPDKIVCYPSIWFGPQLAHHDVSDMCMESWHKTIF
jgi:hypothetical protein